MGIPGNHDGDVFDDGVRTNALPSLATFVRNFCAPTAGIKSPDSAESDRTAMIQPNVYWTLLTPFATFVGLYTNVPEGGVVHPDQADWFEGELAAAPKDRALIVALHHPLNSLDTYHSGSKTMAALIATASAKARRTPDMLCSGHVHNYQRFTVAGAKGVTPHIVAGHGGYHNLHKVAKVDGQPVMTPYTVPNDSGTTLESYFDDRFGFLRLEIDADTIDLMSYTVPRPQESWQREPRLFDKMSFNWRKRAYV
jgi:3',5'-cyclic AMP phosphodiesterase CpdA